MRNNSWSDAHVVGFLLSPFTLTEEEYIEVTDMFIQPSDATDVFIKLFTY